MHIFVLCYFLIVGIVGHFISLLAIPNGEIKNIKLYDLISNSDLMHAKPIVAYM